MLTLLFPLYLSALNIREEMKERKLPSYLIENTAYISLKGLLRINGAEDSWGNVEDRVFIGYQGTEIKFKVNSTSVMIGQQVFMLDVPVKEVEGEIFIPVDNFNDILLVSRLRLMYHKSRFLRKINRLKALNPKTLLYL